MDGWFSVFCVVLALEEAFAIMHAVRGMIAQLCHCADLVAARGAFTAVQLAEFAAFSFVHRGGGIEPPGRRQPPFYP